jgi:hypothetical protein
VAAVTSSLGTAFFGDAFAGTPAAPASSSVFFFAPLPTVPRTARSAPTARRGSSARASGGMECWHAQPLRAGRGARGGGHETP